MLLGRECPRLKAQEDMVNYPEDMVNMVDNIWISIYIYIYLYLRYGKLSFGSWWYGGFLTLGLPPINHPFLDGIFSNKNHQAIGVSPFMETPICPKISFKKRIDVDKWLKTIFVKDKMQPSNDGFYSTMTGKWSTWGFHTQKAKLTNKSN